MKRDVLYGEATSRAHEDGLATPGGFLGRLLAFQSTKQPAAPGSAHLQQPQTAYFACHVETYTR